MGTSALSSNSFTKLGCKDLPNLPTLHLGVGMSPAKLGRVPGEGTETPPPEPGGTPHPAAPH